MAKCPNCNKDIPEEIHFCPYCMEKFTGEEVEYSSKRKSKSFLIVVVACIVMAVICSVVFICLGGRNPKISTDNENATDTTASEDTTMDTRVEHHNPDPDSPNFTKDSTLAWPVKGEILMGFCIRETVYHKTQDVYKRSEGIMIQADMGTPVRCGADGTVMEIGDDEEYGKYVKTNLGNGYTLYYYQLKDIPLNRGDTLKKGIVIGYINEPTEYYTLEGSHLYLKMVKSGTPIDPMDFLILDESMNGLDKGRVCSGN